MPKFRKRPLEIEATRLSHAGSMETREGTRFWEAGDWMITGIEDEQYPCKHSVFEATYEPVNAEAEAYWEEYGNRDYE